MVASLRSAREPGLRPDKERLTPLFILIETVMVCIWALLIRASRQSPSLQAYGPPLRRLSRVPEGHQNPANHASLSNFPPAHFVGATGRGENILEQKTNVPLRGHRKVVSYDEVNERGSVIRACEKSHYRMANGSEKRFGFHPHEASKGRFVRFSRRAADGLNCTRLLRGSTAKY